MRRRDFITILGGAAAMWPLAAGAQQPDRMQRIGVLMGYDENDPQAQSGLSAFKQELATLGWTEDRNLRIDHRWAAGDVNRAGAFAKELVALQPKVILSNTTPVTAALHRETKTIPLVFVVVSDPVGSGFVESLPRPGGNVTGFVNLEASLVEKWLELLKEIAPRVTRVGVMFNPQTASYAEYYLQPLEAVASKLDVKLFAAPVRSESDIGNVITQLGGEPGGGLIVMTDSFNFVHRKSIIALTRQNNVPAMDYYSGLPAEGGLISYGVDTVDLFRRAAGYVDRMLRGTKPAELPVQLPTKFELVVNLKTAKALGLEVPPSILLRADQVIE
jgi:putative ABC transport system substrate-binding protein